MMLACESDIRNQTDAWGTPTHTLTNAVIPNVARDFAIEPWGRRQQLERTITLCEVPRFTQDDDALCATCAPLQTRERFLRQRF
jgi:hypothetical protein